MRETLKEIGLGLALLLLAVLVYRSSAKPLGASTGYDSLNLTPSASTGDTYALAVNGTQAIDMSGNLIAPSLVLGSSTNTAMTHYNCATTTWNPSAVGSSTDATIDLLVPGYVQGDSIVASISTSTQGLAVIAVSTSSLTGTTTAVLFDTDNAGAIMDISTTTVKVCDIN